MGPVVPAATGRTLSSSRETLSHDRAASGLPVMTAVLVATLAQACKWTKP